MRKSIGINVWAMFLLACLSLRAYAEEALVTSAVDAEGKTVPYILTQQNSAPAYVLVLFPGGNGIVNPRMEEGKLVFQLAGNFLIRSRNLLVDEQVATVVTDATQDAVRVQGLLDDISRRFPKARVYIISTSRGTIDTMRLAPYLSEKIAGMVHTSSLSQVGNFNPALYKNRHLVVHHKSDTCKHTPIAAAMGSRDRYGTELLIMEGGISQGEACLAFAHHGYNGIEKETMDKIKAWIRKDQPASS